jgi:alkylation response protein AidB-like acyl-CoA dehydrogenase
MPHQEYYKMLSPEFKYTGAYCTKDEINMAESVRKFVNKEIMPRRQDMEGGWHRDEKLALETQHELYAKLVELGVTKSNLPTEYGGLGLSPVVRQMVNEEISRGDIGLGTMVGKIHWIVSFMLATKRDDLLKEFADRITGQDSWTACVAITEPSGGANLEDPGQEYRTIRTIAKEDGDDYVINGHKIWPGPSGIAEHFQTKSLKGHLGYWTVATTDPEKGEEGVGLFYIPPDAKGMTFSNPYEKMGFCWSDENVDIYFDNVRIPKKYRIDTETGQGAKIVRGYVVGLGRLAGAARLVGLSQAVLEIVLNSAKHREIVGTPQRERSLFANFIGEMFRYIDVARQYYLAVTWQVMRPDIYGDHWSNEMLAKYSAARSFSADCANFVCNRGMEMMGSYGYAYEYNLEKYMRDYKIVQMWLGGAHRDRMDIAQGLYGPFTWGGFDNWVKKQKLA